MRLSSKKVKENRTSWGSVYRECG